MNLDYALVDVFAERALEGNMLAIFTDARGLTDARMQALARETNLAETTFILPDDAADEASNGVRVRIFTTQEELPFAGHPTLGTASWLYWNHPGLRGAETIRLKLAAGIIPVTFRPPLKGEAGVFGTMKQNEPVMGAQHDRAKVARVLGLGLADLDAGLPVQTVSTGMPFVIVPVRSLEALDRLAIPQAGAQAWLAAAGAKFFYCITRAEPGSKADFRARMQFYNGEDPATGSAAGCAIAYLVRWRQAPASRDVMIEQGLAIARPSQIYVQAGLRQDEPHSVFVGGRTIPVARGTFSIA